MPPCLLTCLPVLAIPVLPLVEFNVQKCGAASILHEAMASNVLFDTHLHQQPLPEDQPPALIAHIAAQVLLHTGSGGGGKAVRNGDMELLGIMLGWGKSKLLQAVKLHLSGRSVLPGVAASGPRSSLRRESKPSQK